MHELNLCFHFVFGLRTFEHVLLLITERSRYFLSICRGGHFDYLVCKDKNDYKQLHFKKSNRAPRIVQAALEAFLQQEMFFSYIFLRLYFHFFSFITFNDYSYNHKCIGRVFLMKYALFIYLNFNVFFFHFSLHLLFLSFCQGLNYHCSVDDFRNYISQLDFFFLITVKLNIS